jgi:Cu-Zn family superoxide dismutase
VWTIALIVATGGCSYLAPGIPFITKPGPAAAARIRDASGKPVGNAVFTQRGSAVRILLDVNGLAPGVKAVHLHEVGQCEAPAFASAGGHVNPTKAEHGAKNPRGPHAGDLPDLTVDASGRGHLELTATRVSLAKGAATSLLDGDGSSIVVHERADDQSTDPDGASGARIACGVLVPAGKY